MSIYSRENPLFAFIKERRLLNNEGSAKKIYHIVLDLADSSFSYKVGDAVAILPSNDPNFVNQMLNVLGLDAKQQVVMKDHTTQYSVEEYLTKHANLSHPHKKVMRFLCELQSNEEKRKSLAVLLNDSSLFELYAQTHELTELFNQHREVPIPAQKLVELLPSLLPRFYSIASSPMLYKSEIHLTVAMKHHQVGPHIRYGVCTHYLNDLASIHQTPVPLYLHATRNFLLPSEPSTDMIMVGPGTGIAPFRAFIQERIALNASGRNWLFFGEQHFAYDFLYQTELEAWEESGALRLDVAFSRDQATKYYVQHQMHKQSVELWQWLEKGAYFYVCGDAHHMAKDVDSMLHYIVQEQGKKDPEQASHYIKHLKHTGRYLRDVY